MNITILYSRQTRDPLTLAHESLSDQAKHDTGTGVTFSGRLKRPHNQFVNTLTASVGLCVCVCVWGGGGGGDV